MAELEFPIPECPLGYTYGQVLDIVSQERMEDFVDWMYGQTVALCNGSIYNYETKSYEQQCMKPHGTIYYPSDVKRFVRSRLGG